MLVVELGADRGEVGLLRLLVRGATGHRTICPTVSLVLGTVRGVSYQELLLGRGGVWNDGWCIELRLHTHHTLRCLLVLLESLDVPSRSRAVRTLSAA